MLKTALLLAAGRGARMQPLSDQTPKPLLKVGDKRLIEWQIEALARAGVRAIVINVAHLAAQFAPALGDGSRYGVRLTYSVEGADATAALETLGGLVQALPLLGPAPFIVASADVLTDFDYRRLTRHAALMAAPSAPIDAHLVLVDNPPFHPHGDMGLLANGLITQATPHLTYANIAVFTPRLFTGLKPVKAKLFPWLYAAVARGRVSGEHYRGTWCNIGTAPQLAQADTAVRAGLNLHCVPPLSDQSL
jgi:MurNAc alpha-1-phosphate uridylyltransferase